MRNSVGVQLFLSKPAPEALAFLNVVLTLRSKMRADLQRSRVPQTRARTVGRVIPVASALSSGTEQIIFAHFRSDGLQRLSVLVQALGPSQRIDKRKPTNELARFAIQNVSESVLARMNHQLAHLPVLLHVYQHRLGIRVEVVQVVRSLLEIPPKFSCVRIERHQRIGIEVRPQAIAAVKVRGRIAHTPKDQIELGIVRTGEPARSASQLPGIPHPSLGTRLARLGNRVKAPGKLSCLDVECADIAAMRALPASHTGNDFVPHEERS